MSAHLHTPSRPVEETAPADNPRLAEGAIEPPRPGAMATCVEQQLLVDSSRRRCSSARTLRDLMDSESHLRVARRHAAPRRLSAHACQLPPVAELETERKQARPATRTFAWAALRARLAVSRARSCSGAKTFTQVVSSAAA
mmetsp:Transcript_92507/g.238801  ORF Transcript_92507/g.238801 Transcript_92507/m.238801 type:complete len:141 (+) Transcript_92507:47-469(+)